MSDYECSDDEFSDDEFSDDEFPKTNKKHTITTEADAHLQSIKDKCEQSVSDELPRIKKKKVQKTRLNAICQGQKGWEGAYPPIREFLQNSFDYLELIGPDGFLRTTVDVSRNNNTLFFEIAETRVLSIKVEVSCTS